MNIKQYFERIDFSGKPEVNHETLNQLHEKHVFNVPFENLDVYQKKQFNLDLDAIFNKIINKKRGGFCYELNTIFNVLLRQVGFKSRIISASIFDENGNLGPPFDHMLIYVETNKKYLLDVGFGDLFVKPLELRLGIQGDGRHLFKLEYSNNQYFILSMCSNGIDFQQKYSFNLDEVNIADFTDICLDKQTNPASYFVKNLVCTKPTESGRLTIFNTKFIEKKNGEKFEQSIENDECLKKILTSKFGIVAN